MYMYILIHESHVSELRSKTKFEVCDPRNVTGWFNACAETKISSHEAAIESSWISSCVLEVLSYTLVHTRHAIGILFIG